MVNTLQKGRWVYAGYEPKLSIFSFNVVSPLLCGCHYKVCIHAFCKKEKLINWIELFSIKQLLLPIFSFTKCVKKKNVRIELLCFRNKPAYSSRHNNIIFTYFLLLLIWGKHYRYVFWMMGMTGRSSLWSALPPVKFKRPSFVVTIST